MDLFVNYDCDPQAPPLFELTVQVCVRVHVCVYVQVYLHDWLVLRSCALLYEHAALKHLSLSLSLSLSLFYTHTHTHTHTHIHTHTQTNNAQALGWLAQRTDTTDLMDRPGAIASSSNSSSR